MAQPNMPVAPSGPRPVYNGTATSRLAQNAWDSANAAASARPVYNGTATSRQAQNAWDAAHATNPNPTVSGNPQPTKAPTGGTGYNGISQADSNWYNAYSNAIKNGANNSYQLGKYNQMAKQYGLKNYTSGISSSALQDMSIKALSGDTNAQTYLKNMNYKPLSGDALWNGYTPDKLNASSSAVQNAYMQANPFADYTKNVDMNAYNTGNQALENNQPLSPDQLKAYQAAASKWGLKDMSNPYNQQIDQSNKDYQNFLNSLNGNNSTYQSELNQGQTDYQNYLNTLQSNNQANMGQLQNAQQDALNGETVALNSGLASLDATNFQNQQKLQQDMTNRGIADSGIAADTYLRGQMAANQTYQDAYSKSAQNKATIEGNYADKMNQARNDYANAVNSANNNYLSFQGNIQNQIKSNQDAINAASTAHDNYVSGIQDKITAQQQAKTAAQTQQDQYLTTQTGMVWMGGKPLTVNGKPVTTLDWQKMTETQRHDLATEANTAQQNQNTYTVGMTNANNNATKIANDYAVAQGNLSLSRDKYNLSVDQAAANIKNAQDKVAIAAQNAKTSADKVKYTALSKQLDDINKQVVQFQKSNPGQPIPPAMANAMADIGDKMNRLGGTANFQP